MENHKLERFSVRLVKDAPLMSDKPITKAVDAIQLVGNMIYDMDREVMCVINLKTNGIPINCTFASLGGLNETLAHPRELLKTSFLSNAASMILVHNHPSFGLLPSKADTQITDRMLKLCDMVGIPLLDHIIVGGDRTKYFSFKEKEIMTYSPLKYETDYHNLQFPELAVAEEMKPEMKHKHR